MKKLVLLAFLAISITVKAQLILNSISPEEKVYGLSKIWQEVNYNFVYMDKVEKGMWDNAYKNAIKTVQKTRTDYEYYRELQKFCALLKDGHTSVHFPPKIDSVLQVSMFGNYRIILSNINNKAIVIATNPSIQDEIPIGTELIEVNDMKTWDYIDQNVAPYISASTEHALNDESVRQLFKGPVGQNYHVKFKLPIGLEHELSLTHAKTIEKELIPPEEKQELFNLKWYKGEIAQITLNSFEDPTIDSTFIKILPELYKAKGLIVDLRKNSGGDTDIGKFILQYLSNDSIFYGSKSITRVHIPAYKAWGRHLTVKDTLKNPWAKKSLLAYQNKLTEVLNDKPDIIKLKAQRIVVPTVILISHKTASAAEDFLIYADNQKHMTKIGESTNGSTGQPYGFDLPGGGFARVCTKKDTYFDGRQFVGLGVKPDIEVIPTVEDFIKKKDAVLEKALSFLKTKIK